MANSVDPDQTAPIFTSILYSSVMLGNYLQQTASTDDIYKCIFSWRFKVLHLTIYMLGNFQDFVALSSANFLTIIFQKLFQEHYKC